MEIASVHVIDMYLLVKLSIIMKAVRLFARILTAATKKIINL